MKNSREKPLFLFLEREKRVSFMCHQKSCSMCCTRERGGLLACKQTSTLLQYNKILFLFSRGYLVYYFI